MVELVIGAAFFGLLALSLVYRIAKGPTSGDRMMAVDTCDNLLCCAMILFSMYTHRGIYLDISIIGAVLGIIDTMLVGRYLEGSL